MSGIDSLFVGDFDGLLPPPPQWVQRALKKQATQPPLTLVSAVCPDYSQAGGKFTYQHMGGGIPYTAAQHLKVVATLVARLSAYGIATSYHITLADTEYDLPLVVDHMTGGDSTAFLAHCQSSCDALRNEAFALELPLATCGRFTDLFPTWHEVYQNARAIVDDEAATNRSVKQDADASAVKRAPLYRAMTGQFAADLNYCREMVLRQWAQYMTWGEVAEQRFGAGIVMLNHTTPNLSKVNHPAFRKGRPRIPILQLAIATLPDT